MAVCSTDGEKDVIRAVARVLWVLLLVCLYGVTRAEVVRDLYAARVPVADQSARALDRASREALAEVLVKVSGSVEILQNPTITEILPEARAQVQQYAYHRDEGPGGGLSASFEFDGAWVTGLVTRAGAPLWTANRPQVLVWLVAEDARGRYFVNRESAPQLVEQLMEEFARRGVPAQLPLFDLADAAALSTAQAWRMYAPALQAASGRYGLADILAGRLATLSSGQSAGDWSYFHDGERSERSVTAVDPGAFAREGVAIVAEEMAARYAVAPSGSTAGGVAMTVAGVYSYADYADIVAWLERLELIEHANVERVSGGQLELRLHAQADARQLAALIELNNRLLPVPPGNSTSQLTYQWQ